MVQVHHQHRQRGLCALGTAQALVQQGEKGPAVEHPGQRVCIGQVAQPAGHKLIGQHQHPKRHQQQRHRGLQQHPLRQLLQQAALRSQAENHGTHQHPRPVKPHHPRQQVTHRHPPKPAIRQGVCGQQKTRAREQPRQQKPCVGMGQHHRQIHRCRHQRPHGGPRVPVGRRGPSHVGTASQPGQVSGQRTGRLHQHHRQHLGDMVTHQQRERKHRRKKERQGPQPQSRNVAVEVPNGGHHGRHYPQQKGRKNDEGGVVHSDGGGGGCFSSVHGTRWHTREVCPVHFN